MPVAIVPSVVIEVWPTYVESIVTASAETVIVPLVPITLTVGIGPLKLLPVQPAPATIAVRSPTVGDAQLGLAPAPPLVSTWPDDPAPNRAGAPDAA